MVHLSPPAICPKADLSHWDLCQGSSREPLPQIESTDLGHSPLPTGGDWLHQQPEGNSVEWKASGCCPPLLLLSLFSQMVQVNSSTQAESRTAGPWGSSDAVSGGWGRETE